MSYRISDDDCEVEPGDSSVSISRPRMKRKLPLIQDSDPEVLSESDGCEETETNRHSSVAKATASTSRSIQDSEFEELEDQDVTSNNSHTSTRSTCTPVAVSKTSRPSILRSLPRPVLEQQESLTRDAAIEQCHSSPASSGYCTPGTYRLGSSNHIPRTEVPVNMDVTPCSSKGDVNSLGIKELLVRVYNRQGEILQRLKSLPCSSAHLDTTSCSKEKSIHVPLAVKNAVRQGYRSGEKRGLSWSFEGKRVNDDVNEPMTSHIKNFVQGWNPSFNDDSVLNCALTRYFVTKKQEHALNKSNKKDSVRKKRASYERKKEKLKRRLTALEKQEIGAAKKTIIKAALKLEFMSSDESDDGGFISHPASWESEKFRSYKFKLDGTYLETCSTKSKRLLNKRVIGDAREKDPPNVDEHLKWILRN